MQFEYDPEQLITEVSKRPALWDNEHPGYRAKHLKAKQWSDVVKELVSLNEITMTKSEMRELELQLQKKWKSLRDCYKKFLANQNRFKKPYIFAKHLSFLLKDNQWPMPQKKTRSPTESDEGDSFNTTEDSQKDSPRNVWVPKKKIRIQKIESEFDDKDNYEDCDDYDYEVNVNNEDETSAADPSVSGQFAFANVDISPKIDNDDTDKMFLMSLLPHLKSIPEQFRLNVKLELMQVLRVANESTAKLKFSDSID